MLRNDTGAGGSSCRLVSESTPPVRLGRRLQTLATDSKVAHSKQGLLYSAAMLPARIEGDSVIDPDESQSRQERQR